MADPLPVFRLKPATFERDQQRATLREYWRPILAQAVLSAHNHGELVASIVIRGYSLSPCDSGDQGNDLKAAIDSVLAERGYTPYQNAGDELMISWAEPVFMARKSDDDAGVLPYADTLALKISEDAIRMFGRDLADYIERREPHSARFMISDERLGIRRGTNNVQNGRLRVYMFLLKEAGYTARFQDRSPLDPSDIGCILVHY